MNEQALATAVGLQTLAIDALVRELRRDREVRWLLLIAHASVAAVTAAVVFGGLWALVPDGLLVVK